MDGPELGMEPAPEWEGDEGEAFVAWSDERHARFVERVYEAFLDMTETSGGWFIDPLQGTDKLVFYATNDRIRALMRDERYQPDDRRYAAFWQDDLNDARYDVQAALVQLVKDGRIVPVFREGWPGYARSGRAASVSRPSVSLKPAGPVPLKLKASVWAKSNGRCWYCGDELNPFTNFSIDHVVPRIAGGSNDPHNLVPCCSSCNSIKRDRPLEDFRRDMPGAIFFFEHEGIG